MGLFSRTKRAKAKPGREMIAPNPHLNPRVRGGFFSGDVSRLLAGWDTTSNTIDYYLKAELSQLRARSRRMVRNNPYGTRYINTLKTNVIGPNGINIQAQTQRFTGGEMVLDTQANDALEVAFRDWSQSHCDYSGRLTWVDMQNMAISCAGQDGEYMFQTYQGASAGKYGFQLRVIDPEEIDTQKNEQTRTGEVRLGVEYNSRGDVIWYHFKKVATTGGRSSSETYKVRAEHILHGFISEWPGQSRGTPWMHASLERSKHLEKYDESAIVNARASASTMAVIHSEPGDTYTGDSEGEGKYADATIDQYEPGTIKDIGQRTITQLDPQYPHQMYSDFVKSQLRGIASGLGISYHALSNDLEGVNYSSIRAGVLEDREIYKAIQNWLIRGMIRPVYELWVKNAVPKRAVMIGTRPLARPVTEYYAAHFQPRRWAWVDPQKDGAANQLAIDSRLKSRSQIMREQGDDPESVWREIQRDEETMKSLGIQPIQQVTATEEVGKDEE